MIKKILPGLIIQGKNHDSVYIVTDVNENSISVIGYDSQGCVIPERTFDISKMKGIEHKVLFDYNLPSNSMIKFFIKDWKKSSEYYGYTDRKKNYTNSVLFLHHIRQVSELPGYAFFLRNDVMSGEVLMHPDDVEFIHDVDTSFRFTVTVGESVTIPSTNRKYGIIKGENYTVTKIFDDFDNSMFGMIQIDSEDKEKKTKQKYVYPRMIKKK